MNSESFIMADIRLHRFSENLMKWHLNWLCIRLKIIHCRDNLLFNRVNG